MSANGLENPSVLDAMVYDSRIDAVVLAMYERREWDGGDGQLLQLEEKMNAYLSFLLDGEFEEAFPQYRGKRLEIHLRTVHEPSEEAWGLIGRMREQLNFQQINFEVVQTVEPDLVVGGCCGGRCGGNVGEL